VPSEKSESINLKKRRNNTKRQVLFRLSSLVIGNADAEQDAALDGNSAALHSHQ